MANAYEGLDVLSDLSEMDSQAEIATQRVFDLIADYITEENLPSFRAAIQGISGMLDRPEGLARIQEISRHRRES